MTSFFSTHSLACLLTLAGLFSFWWFFPFQKRLKLSFGQIVFITITLMLWGFLAARYLFPFVEAFGNVSRMANLRLYGIIYFDCIGFYITTLLIDTDRKLFFDVCSISMVVCAILGRIDCFVKGCCYGVPFFDTGFRWPIREIELVTNICFYIYFMPRVYQGKTHGEVYPIYMIYYGIIRFFLECFRVEGDPIGAFHLAHVWSIIAIAIGISFLFILDRNVFFKWVRNKKGGKRV